MVADLASCHSFDPAFRLLVTDNGRERTNMPRDIIAV